MLWNPPPIKVPRRRPPRPKPPTQSPPVAALVLTAASYNHDVEPVVILTFDRAIDIASLDGNQIVLQDGFDLGLKFKGTGAATLDAPGVLRIVLVDDGDADVPGTELTALAGNGIVAADGGGAWPGVSNLGLPFP